MNNEQKDILDNLTNTSLVTLKKIQDIKDKRTNNIKQIFTAFFNIAQLLNQIDEEIISETFIFKVSEGELLIKDIDSNSIFANIVYRTKENDQWHYGPPEYILYRHDTADEIAKQREFLMNWEHFLIVYTEGIKNTICSLYDRISSEMEVDSILGM